MSRCVYAPDATPAPSSPLALPGTLVLAGAGKMGGAMLRGWLEAGADASLITVIDPKPSDELQALAAKKGFAVRPDADGVHDAAVLVLAVKPMSASETPSSP